MKQISNAEKLMSRIDLTIGILWATVCVAVGMYLIDIVLPRLPDMAAVLYPILIATTVAVTFLGRAALSKLLLRFTSAIHVPTSIFYDYNTGNLRLISRMTVIAGITVCTMPGPASAQQPIIFSKNTLSGITLQSNRTQTISTGVIDLMNTW